MKVRNVSLLSATIGFVLGLVVAFWFGGPMRSAMDLAGPNTIVMVERVAGRETLVIDWPDWNPGPIPSSWNVVFHQERRQIDISGVSVLINPFADRCEGRPPLVISNGLLSGPDTYNVRYWDGEQFVSLGRLRVEETAGEQNKLTWYPREAK